MNLIAKPGSFGDGRLTLGRKQIEDHAVIFSVDQRQLGRFLTYAPSNGTRIETVRLASTTIAAA
jgi:hypothetical protein